MSTHVPIPLGEYQALIKSAEDLRAFLKQELEHDRKASNERVLRREREIARIDTLLERSSEALPTNDHQATRDRLYDLVHNWVVMERFWNENVDYMKLYEAEDARSEGRRDVFVGRLVEIAEKAYLGGIPVMWMLTRLGIGRQTFFSKLPNLPHPQPEFNPTGFPNFLLPEYVVEYAGEFSPGVPWDKNNPRISLDALMEHRAYPNVREKFEGIKRVGRPPKHG